MNRAFDVWAAEQLGVTRDELESMKVLAALDVFISRLEAAKDRGARNPLVTASSKRAGGNSRACTKRMLEQLGFTPPQRRAVHRLLAGSPAGWPGLLQLFVQSQDLDRSMRQYARRQLQSLG